MRAPLSRTAPAFVEMAHRIVWAGAATVDADGRPWSRVLHPLWTWDGTELTGIVATSPLSPKADHLARHPHISFTYWHPAQDTCSAMCDAEWDPSPEGRAAGWEALKSAPEPVGYDPGIILTWEDPTSPTFGILRLRPWRLYVLPGSVTTGDGGDVLSWQQG
ncbi:MAG TPA: pyridoxamine 5'-phosphate oxidase family protein [Iamia sp.]